MGAPLLKLNTGAAIPALGFGTGSIASSDVVKDAVICAIESGYRHFDTAGLYGTDRGSTWFSSLSPFDMSPEGSLSELKLDYLDLFLVHFPVSLKGPLGSFNSISDDNFLPLDLASIWKEMEQCFHQGLAKAIGVSNFSVSNFKKLLQTAEIVPSVNQVELHPICQQSKLREFCKGSGIQVFAWSPLGGLGKPWGSESVLENPVIKEMAAKYDRPPSQVRYIILISRITQLGLGAVVKSYNSERISQNLESFNFRLSEEDRSKIKNITPQQRLAPFKELSNSVARPDLWDDV